MAKVKPLNAAPGAVPTARGLFYVRDTKWGPVAQAWPKKRGKAKEGGRLWAEQQFRAAAAMSANPSALDLGTAIEMVKGTTYVPRDFLMSCAYGLGYQLVNPDGTVWLTRHDMSDNPQYLLDNVTDTVGAMLFRDTYGWVGLDPGTNGYILTAEAGKPVWKLPAQTTFPGATITTLKRTSNQGALLANEWTPTWQAADIDENNVWDAGNPTRLYLPADIERIRLSINLRISTSSSESTWRYDFKDDAGADTFFGNANGYFTKSGSSSIDPQFNIVGPWCAVPATNYVTCRLRSTVAKTVTILAGSSITLECI
jgi:hypothetical protein